MVSQKVGALKFTVSPYWQGAEMIEVRRDSTMSELLEKMKLSDSTHEVAGDAQKREIDTTVTTVMTSS